MSPREEGSRSPLWAIGLGAALLVMLYVFCAGPVFFCAGRYGWNEHEGIGRVMASLIYPHFLLAEAWEGYLSYLMWWFELGAG